MIKIHDNILSACDPPRELERANDHMPVEEIERTNAQVPPEDTQVANIRVSSEEKEHANVQVQPEESEHVSDQVQLLEEVYQRNLHEVFELEDIDGHEGGNCEDGEILGNLDDDETLCLPDQVASASDHAEGDSNNDVNSIPLMASPATKMTHSKMISTVKHMLSTSLSQRSLLSVLLLYGKLRLTMKQYELIRLLLSPKDNNDSLTYSHTTVRQKLWPFLYSTVFAKSKEVELPVKSDSTLIVSGTDEYENNTSEGYDRTMAKVKKTLIVKPSEWARLDISTYYVCNDLFSTYFQE